MKSPARIPCRVWVYCCRAAHIVQRPDEDSQRVNPQPQPIEPAGAPGLGVFDAAKIQLKKIDLG